DGAVATDHEARCDAAFEVRVAAEALLVAHAETAVVLTHDALDDLRRQTSAHAGRTHAHLGSARLVRSAEAAVTGAEALAGAGAGAVTERTDRSETDTLAATTAAFTDAGQTETAGA